MRKARTVMLEQGTQTPSPAPDLIPAETKNQARTNIRIGTANGGTSKRLNRSDFYRQARSESAQAGWPKVTLVIPRTIGASSSRRTVFTFLSFSFPCWRRFKRRIPPGGGRERHGSEPTQFARSGKRPSPGLRASRK
jgi:hypothetical protein